MYGEQSVAVHARPCHVIPFYAILFFSIPFHSIPFYSVPFFILFFPWIRFDFIPPNPDQSRSARHAASSRPRIPCYTVDAGEGETAGEDR